MCGKIEFMDDACSQIFTQKLEDYFSIFVPKIQAKFQNQMTVKAGIFYKKIYLEAVRPRNLNLVRKSSTALILRNLPFD